MNDKKPLSSTLGSAFSNYVSFPDLWLKVYGKTDEEIAEIRARREAMDTSGCPCCGAEFYEDEDE